MKTFTKYATIYKPEKTGICHGCINYAQNHRLSGAMFIIELKKEAANMPIFDISNCTKIIGLNANNIEKYGGVRVK